MTNDEIIRNEEMNSSEEEKKRLYQKYYEVGLKYAIESRKNEKDKIDVTEDLEGSKFL